MYLFILLFLIYYSFIHCTYLFHFIYKRFIHFHIYLGELFNYFSWSIMVLFYSPVYLFTLLIYLYSLFLPFFHPFFLSLLFSCAELPFILGGVEEEVVTVLEGDSTSLQCLASGYPEPTISWFKVITNSVVTLFTAPFLFIIHFFYMEWPFIFFFADISI